MDVRQERSRAEAHVRRRETAFTDISVWWYQFSEELTETDDLYDEGPERRYLPPVRVQLLWLVEEEAPDNLTPEGRVPYRSISGAAMVTTLREAGVANAERSESRISDVIEVEGEYYKVVSYDATGHWGSVRPADAAGLNVGFQAVRRLASDLPLDVYPPRT